MTTTRIKSAVFALILLGFVAGCNASMRVRLAVAGDQLGQAVVRLQTEEIAYFQQGLISEESHRSWQIAFKLIAQHIMLMNEAIRASNFQQMQHQITAILNIIDLLMQKQMLPMDPNKQIILRSLLETVRTIVITMSVGAQG